VAQAKQAAKTRRNASSPDAPVLESHHGGPAQDGVEGAHIAVAGYTFSSAVQPIHGLHITSGEEREDSAQISEAILASRVSANEEELLRTRMQRQLQEAIEASRSKTCAGAATLDLALDASTEIGEEELSAVLATLQATLKERDHSVVGRHIEQSEPSCEPSDIDVATDGSSGPLKFDLVTLAMVEGIQRTLQANGLDGDIDSAQAWDALDQWWCEDAEAAEAAMCKTLGLLVDEASTSQKACSSLGGA